MFSRQVSKMRKAKSLNQLSKLSNLNQPKSRFLIEKLNINGMIILWKNSQNAPFGMEK